MRYDVVTSILASIGSSRQAAEVILHIVLVEITVIVMVPPSALFFLLIALSLEVAKALRINLEGLAPQGSSTYASSDPTVPAHNTHGKDCKVAEINQNRLGHKHLLLNNVCLDQVREKVLRGE